jgi:hypothetical protein
MLMPVTETEESFSKRYLISFMVVATTSDVVLVSHSRSRSLLRFLQSRFGILIIVVLSRLLVGVWVELVLFEDTYNEVAVFQSFTLVAAVPLSDIHFQRCDRLDAGWYQPTCRQPTAEPHLGGNNLLFRYRTHFISEFNA